MGLCIGIRENTTVVVTQGIEANPRVPGNVDESLKTYSKQTLLARAITEGEKHQLLAVP